MANLKELRSRIDNVKGTKRITSAMKMVAAAKLRRAQQNAERTRPYSKRMGQLIGALSKEYFDGETPAQNGPPLLVGKQNKANPLYIIISSDRGLCGGFNSNLVKFVLTKQAELNAQGKAMNLIMIGKKIVSAIGFTDSTFEVHEDMGKILNNYDFAQGLAERIIKYFNDDEFSECTLVFNRFISIMVQEMAQEKLIPFQNQAKQNTENTEELANFEYEPDREDVLNEILPKNIAVQIYSAILESSASEQAARMTAMDSATRNAEDMIDRITLIYNRQRQANITKELIEIISGAEAL